MRNLTKKMSAIVLTTVFAAMQISIASPIDTGLGAGNGGAVINGTSGAPVDVTTGTGYANINVGGDSYIQWDTLNVNSGESLNFNAVNGATGVTVLNTVQNGMSNIYGSINANDGIAKLIISNPNGMLYDGAKFTTAGDVLLTTQPMTATFTTDGIINPAVNPTALGVVTIQNSDFSVGGEFNIVAPNMSILKSAIKTGKGLKLTTTDGLNLVVDPVRTGSIDQAVEDIFVNEEARVHLQAVQIDGDVYITSGKGTVKTTDGGTINGNLTINSDGDVALNYTPNGKLLEVTGDVNVKGDGLGMFARNAKIGGNLNMENGGGFLDVGNVIVGKDMNLTTTDKSTHYLQGACCSEPEEVKHFVHVIGTTDVKGNVNINSKHNIHIGGYDYDARKLADGSLTVGGDLTAHATDGHVTVTIDTKANKIDLKSDTLNVLTSDDAVLTANEYKFSSNGYIGAIKDYTKEDGTVLTKDQQIVGIMENYIYIPNDIDSHAYLQIAGGNITQINTPTNAYIGSKGDVTLTGANAKNVNITAYDNSKLTITGPNVHANNINVGEETGYLKLDFSGRDFTTNYTNIKDGVVKTIRPDEVITYELTDGPNGYNQPTLTPGEKTTYLIGPGITPQNPDPNAPDATRNVLWVPDDVMKAPINTPVAFAADLDEDEDGTPVRKNVDGSVTVVRAMPVGK